MSATTMRLNKYAQTQLFVLNWLQVYYRGLVQIVDINWENRGGATLRGEEEPVEMFRKDYSEIMDKVGEDEF